MRERKMTRRELLKGLAATGVSTALLAACRPAATPLKPPEEEAAPPPEPTPVEKAPEAVLPGPAATVEAAVESTVVEGFDALLSTPSEKITLLYWWGNEYEPALEYTHKIMAKFSLAYPNVVVEPVAAQNCDMFVTAAAAGTPPDLFHTWDCVERMGVWARRDMIIPLDEYINASKFDLDDYVPGIMDTCKMDGNIWGMVDTAGVFLLWMRVPYLKDIGKSAEDFPADTDEMWAWAEELTSRDDAGNIQRLGCGIPGWTWPRLTWIVNFGGEFWDVEKGQPTPDHPGVLEALHDLLKRVEFYGVDALDRWSASIGSQGGEQNPWLAGNMVMEVEGDWHGQQIFDFFPEWEAGKEYTCTAPPPPPQSKQHGPSAVAYWSWPWVIPSGTKYPEWSWELLRFCLSREYAANVHGKFKEILVRKSMMDDERLWWPAADAAREIVKGDRAKSTVMPMNPVAGEYLDLLAEAFEEILHLKLTPEEGMNRVKEETLQKLEEVMGE